MEIVREKEFVNQFHFDARNPKWEEANGVPETKISVEFQLVEKNEEQTMTKMVVIMRYMIVLDQFVVSGAMTQLVTVTNRYIDKPADLTEEEKRSLVSPLIDMLKRLTYEVTEVAFDAPGIKLEI
ncbi:DUF1149 family protein [Streptococcus cameli]